MNPIDNVLTRLKNVQPCSSGWTALCPAHEDLKPSLSVSIGNDKQVLMKCHAGCDIHDIVSALGLSMNDLYPHDGNRQKKRKIVKIYDYRDEHGNLMYQVLRYKPKSFNQRRPNGIGGWVWNLHGVQPLLYRLPETIEAIRNNRFILIVEGEKDVDNVVSIGLDATCNSLGAGKWHKHFNNYFKDSRVVIIPDNDLPGKEHANKVACNLKGIAREIRIVALPGLVEKGDISDWLSNGGSKEVLIEIVNKTPLWESHDSSQSMIGKDSKEDQFHLTDTGNAQRLVKLFGQQIRYNEKPYKSWFIWNGKQWEYDTTNKIQDYADRTIREMYKQASEIENSKEREILNNWIKSTESFRRRKDMVSIASSIQSIVIKADEFDRNPWLFNTLNYTLDLSSGEVVPRKHEPSDFITKVSPVIYDTEASCPHWNRFLNEIFPNKEEIRVFIQRTIGYSLTGITSEQCLLFCYGTGANGKTVFLETLKILFGDYAGKAPSEMIVQQRYTGIPSDIASLKGKRFIIASEIEENRRLAESKVKDLTGGDTIVARKLYGDWFEFSPTHKLWIFGNHKPIIRGDDQGIWRRMLLIPFTVTIAEDKQKPIYQLLDEFKKELSGILNWALQGYMEYRERGLNEPDEIKKAVSEYRTDMDLIAQFINDCCVMDPENMIPAKELWTSYNNWANENWEKHISNRIFYQKLRERGFQIKTGSGNKTYIYGIKLISANS